MCALLGPGSWPSPAPGPLPLRSVLQRRMPSDKAWLPPGLALSSSDSGQVTAHSLHASVSSCIRWGNHRFYLTVGM